MIVTRAERTIRIVATIVTTDVMRLAFPTAPPMRAACATTGTKTALDGGGGGDGGGESRPW